MALSKDEQDEAERYVTGYCRSISSEHAEAVAGQLAETVYSRVWELGMLGSIEDFEPWLHSTTADETSRQLFELRHVRRPRSKKFRAARQFALDQMADPHQSNDPLTAAILNEEIRVLNQCLAAVESDSRKLLDTYSSRRGAKSVHRWAEQSGVSRQIAYYRREKVRRQVCQRMNQKGVDDAD